MSTTEKQGGGGLGGVGMLLSGGYSIHYPYLTSMHSPKEIWKQILSDLFVSALISLWDCPYTIEIIKEEWNILNIISNDQEEGVAHMQVHIM